MKTNTFPLARWFLIGLLGIGGLILVGFTQLRGKASISLLQEQPPLLPVQALKQSSGTSCGEAVIAMTYNYAYPENPITESEVISYALANQYYTPNRSPYTSPTSMVMIARYYTENSSAGRVYTSGQGLALLIDKLRNGEPVIIDVLSNFQDPESEAHFIVITGISTDSAREDAIVIHYNDPLTGTQETSDWLGSAGVWNAWRTNDDPGGSGWWLAISPS